MTRCARLTADGHTAREPALAGPSYERVTVRELALRYAMERTALDVELEAEHLRLARERRPACVGPARRGLTTRRGDESTKRSSSTPRPSVGAPLRTIRIRPIVVTDGSAARSRRCRLALTRVAAVIVAARRRAARAAGRGRQRAGVRGALRALSPAAVSLLPLDRAATTTTPRTRCSRRWRARFARCGRGQRDAPVRPWLFRIAHNEAVSLLRRRSQTVELSDDPECARRRPRTQPVERERAARRSWPTSGAARAPARRARDARAERALARGDRARARTVSVGAKQAIFEARRRSPTSRRAAR